MKGLTPPPPWLPGRARKSWLMAELLGLEPVR